MHRNVQLGESNSSPMNHSAPGFDSEGTLRLAQARFWKTTWTDRVLTAGAWSIAVLIGAVFCLILFSIVRQGLGAVSWQFLTQPPVNAGRDGGIGSIIVSTGMVLAVALIAAIPIGLGTAILLAESSSPNGHFGRWVRRSLEMLAGVPSIVFGLFGNAFFCIYLGLGFSILSGGLTLACMVLPLFIRAAEEGIRSVPSTYRLGAAALGMSRTSTLFQLILPNAAPGIAVGLILGTGRALAETAALIFTSGYVDRMPSSIFSSGRVLSIHIYDLSMNVPGGDRHAYASAFVLVMLLLLINSTVSVITHRVKRH